MDLVSSFSAFKQAEVAQQVQTRVAKKVLDAQRAEGDAAMQLLQSAMPAAGGTPSGVSPPGLGGLVDVTA